MEQPSCHNGKEKGKDKFAILFVKESCDAKRCKGKEIVAADLQGREHIGAAALKKLQDAVGNSGKNARLDAVKVADDADAEHGECSDGTSVGHIDLNVGKDKAHGDGNAADGKPFRGKAGAFLLAVHDDGGQDEG